MCGIVGYVSFNGHPDKRIIRKMISVIEYRGPDSSAIYVDNLAGLGVNRLSIIDLKTGNQPIFNEDGSMAVVFNGEIYNFKKLRSELQLQGHRFGTKSDTEVLVHLYEEYGKESPKFLNGMFAFALWDKKKRQLFLARDGAGIKPLYFWQQGETFIFGSELKAILKHPKVKREINFRSLRLYSALGYIAENESIFKDIHKVRPGQSLTFSSKGVSVDKFWSLGNVATESTPDNIDELLKSSILGQTVADVPWGVFLSGGIDSSLITHYLYRSNKKIKTFSIGFSEDKFDESNYARYVAKLYRTDHHEETFSYRDLEDLFSVVTRNLDEPLADPSVFPTYKLAKMARRYVKVALSGDGGDELFGGYPQYLGHSYAQILRFLPQSFLWRLYGLYRFTPISFGKYNKGETYYRAFASIRQSWHNRQFLWNPQTVDKYFDDQWLEKIIKSIPDDYPISIKAQMLDFMTYLRDDMLVKVDRMSMVNSLEVRVPFLDRGVIAYAFGKNRRHVSLWETKKILRGLARKYLPREITQRKKKGFGIPLAEWTRGPLRDLVGDYLNNPNLYQFFPKSEVDQARANHLSVRTNHSREIWMLVMFSAWLENWT